MSLAGALQNEVLCQEFWVLIICQEFVNLIEEQLSPDFAQQLHEFLFQSRGVRGRDFISHPGIWEETKSSRLRRNIWSKLRVIYICHEWGLSIWKIS